MLLLPVLSLALLACDVPNNRPSPSDHPEKNTVTKTPEDLSEGASDQVITEEIREAIVDSEGLSNDAKNISITTLNGVVTLRGRVANSKEKELIARTVSEVQGIISVKNQLEIKNSN